MLMSNQLIGEKFKRAKNSKCLLLLELGLGAIKIDMFTVLIIVMSRTGIPRQIRHSVEWYMVSDAASTNEPCIT